MTLQLRLDTSHAWLAGGEPNQLASLGAVLDKLRDEICDIDEKMLAGEIPTPASKQPLGSGFVRLPERLLAEYEAERPASELGRMLAATKQLMTEVDRVVVLGDAANLSGPRALQACCQPYFNELSRGQRGSRPRLVFVGESLDNDEVQGVLHLLGAHRGRAATTLDERWGLVVMGSGTEPNPAACLLRPLLAAQQINNGHDPQAARARVLFVAGKEDPLRSVASELESENCFSLPDGVGPRFSVLSMSGLLTAALLGINVMKLLEGARHISHHFRTTKAADNLVLQFAGVNHLMDQKSAGNPRRWCAWSQALSETNTWYRQLLSGCLGKELLVEAPLNIERQCPRNTLACPPLLNQIVVDGFRFDPLPVEAPLDSSLNQDCPQPPGIESTSDGTLVQSLQVVHARTQRALQLCKLPSVQLSLPQVDEPCLGQLLQLLMLATVVEGRLLGCNPYS